MLSDKETVLTAYPTALARWGSEPGADEARWIILRSDEIVDESYGAGATEGEAWSDAVWKILEESAMRR
ncbi:hypothetical protein [Singulisphaera sp. PoT]|uniref:hypothetical protein n=1 Tax=Singulisphaera sp. PoT TaxID=3411797 RepID=UPI003BF60F54